MDFRDWHIFKTGSVLQIGSLLAVVDREILRGDDDWSEALVDWLPVTDLLLSGMAIRAKNLPFYRDRFKLVQ